MFAGMEHVWLTPNWALEPEQILFGCRHLACLTREGVEGYVERNETDKMLTSKRKMNGRQWKQLRIFDKRVYELIGGKQHVQLLLLSLLKKRELWRDTQWGIRH